MHHAPWCRHPCTMSRVITRMRNWKHQLAHTTCHHSCPTARVHTRAISRDKEKPPLKHGMSTPVAREPSDTSSSHTRPGYPSKSVPLHMGARDVNSAAACNLFGRCTKQTPSRTGNSTTYQQQLSSQEMNACVLVCVHAERTPCTALGHTRHALPPLILPL